MSVGNRRAKDRNAILIDGRRDVINHIIHVDGNGICTGVLIDVLYALPLLRFAKDVPRCSTLQTFDGKSIIIVKGEVHRLIDPLLGRRFLKCDFSFEDAVSLVGNDRTACTHVATNVHRYRKHSYGLVASIDSDACHTVLCNGEWCCAFCGKGAISIA